VRILVVERLLLKKKKECDGEEEEWTPVRGIGRRVPCMMVPYKICRTPASMTPFNPPWQGPIHMYR
jgi:hypothetical protein